jgi:hypothetical protein
MIRDVSVKAGASQLKFSEIPEYMTVWFCNGFR